MTRLIGRRDLLATLEVDACLAALRDGFGRAEAATIPGQRVVTDLPFPGTATALIPGLLPGIEAYTIKVNAKFPGATPALRGVICLHSGRDGELLALLDSATVTAWRTGLAAALATDLLAAPDAAVVGVIGAGAQAEMMVTGLAALRSWPTLVVFDTNLERARSFANRHNGRVVAGPVEVAALADIVLLATWTRTPLLTVADTRPGQHLTTLGGDEPGKRELSADLLDSALLAVDDRKLAVPGADLTLGELLRGQHPGRTRPEDLTVYAPVGLPWQDLCLAWLAYQETERRGVGPVIDLLE